MKPEYVFRALAFSVGAIFGYDADGAGRLALGIVVYWVLMAVWPMWPDTPERTPHAK